MKIQEIRKSRTPSEDEDSGDSEVPAPSEDEDSGDSEVPAPSEDEDSGDSEDPTPSEDEDSGDSEARRRLKMKIQEIRKPDAV